LFQQQEEHCGIVVAGSGHLSGSVRRRSFIVCSGSGIVGTRTCVVRPGSGIVGTCTCLVSGGAG
jgi:hypothetical protein